MQPGNTMCGYVDFACVLFRVFHLISCASGSIRLGGNALLVHKNSRALISGLCSSIIDYKARIEIIFGYGLASILR